MVELESCTLFSVQTKAGCSTSCSFGVGVSTDANTSLWHEMPHVVFGRVIILSHGFICNPACTHTNFSIHALWRGEYTAFYLKRKKKTHRGWPVMSHGRGGLLIC